MQVYIKSFGCSTNNADSEVLAGCLAQSGYKLAQSEVTADMLIYNTCAVKGPTENRIIQALKQAPENKKLIIAGCLPKISFERLKREVRFDAVVGASIGEGIVDVVKRVFNGEKVIDYEAIDSKPQLNLPRVTANPIISIIPINYGCLGSCAYCCVVLARGHLRSHNIQEIVERVQSDLAVGAKEFWVTSQDTACYGREIGKNLAELLEALSRLDGEFRVRVGMMTPNMLIDMQDQLIEAFKSDKIFKFIHLPIQSGDNQTLKRMRRFYTVEDFKETVQAFRAAIPDLTLATDVIVGFPGETEEAFQNTLKLLKEVKPDIVNVSKFFARPKTPAVNMHKESIELSEIKHRSTATAQLTKQLSFERNNRWVGWVGEVLIDETGKINGTWVGRNFAYKPIAIKSEENFLGKTLKVKVVKAYPTYLAGIIVQ